MGRIFNRNIILESSDSENAFPNVDFKPAAGWTIQLERRQDPLFVGVRYTHMDYHTVDTAAFANASSLGAYVGLDLPLW